MSHASKKERSNYSLAVEMYPLAGTLAFSVGMMDLMLLCHGFIPGDSKRIEFFLWFKKAFLCMSFVFFDVFYANNGSDLWRWLTVVMFIAWALRKWVMNAHII